MVSQAGSPSLFAPNYLAFSMEWSEIVWSMQWIAETDQSNERHIKWTAISELDAFLARLLSLIFILIKLIIRSFGSLSARELIWWFHWRVDKIISHIRRDRHQRKWILVVWRKCTQNIFKWFESENKLTTSEIFPFNCSCEQENS